MEYLPGQEHNTIEESIDNGYALAAAGKAKILTWFQFPKGPIHVPFLEFYGYFEYLFDITHLYAPMREERNKKLLEETKKWFLIKHVDKEGNIPIERVMDGIGLFDTYRNALIDENIIGLHK